MFGTEIVEICKSGGFSFLSKAAHDLTMGERKDLPKSDFAVSAKKSNTGALAYPMPDKRHAQVALGLSKMHGDQADITRVRNEVKEKYPELLHKAASVPLPQVLVALAKTAGVMNALGRLGQGAAEHKAELAGLGILAVPSLDDAQAHVRAGLAGDYNKGGVESRTVLPHAAKPASEIAGLGVLAGPSLAHLMKH